MKLNHVLLLIVFSCVTLPIDVVDGYYCYDYDGDGPYIAEVAVARYPFR